MKNTTSPPGSPESREDQTAAPVSAALNKAAQDARDIVDKAAGLADSAARKAIPAAAQFAHKTVDQVAAGAAPAAAWLNEHADDLNITQERLVEDARQYIRKNPLTSVGIALAVGFLISRITR
jgi:ElaB/YqjD/DUF883 family membrane-anchored ribosome-binding protein